MAAYAMPEKMQKLSNDTLKWIALVTMLIDHIAYALLWNVVLEPQTPITKGSTLYTVYIIYRIMRGIGRTAFPIYCFCLVEGFLHTKKRSVYAMRLAVFALISEIPFNLAICGKLLAPDFQNVFFTLLLGLLAIWAMDYLKDREAFGLLAAIAMGGVAHLLQTDYSWQGITLIVIFYLLHKWRIPQIFFGSFALYNEVPAVIPGYLLLLLYNGKRKTHGLFKYFFYAFYPAHLLLLYLAAVILKNRI